MTSSQRSTTGQIEAGLSRTEYLRRTLAREKHGAIADVTVDDLARFAETFADLADVDIMDDAWS